MSAVSGLNAKAEKGRSKYVALDINSIYKGKSLENPKATGKCFNLALFLNDSLYFFEMWIRQIGAIWE